MFYPYLLGAGANDKMTRHPRMPGHDESGPKRHCSVGALAECLAHKESPILGGHGTVLGIIQEELAIAVIIE